MKKKFCEQDKKLASVSDMNKLYGTARCPTCDKKVKITIPDYKMHGNTAKFAKHTDDRICEKQ